MRWLVTGAGGMLGQDTVHELRARGEDVTGLGRAAPDITEPAAVERALAEHRPDVVVNCAACTAVDAAETDEERALLVNGVGPRLLARARACAARRARLIHISTDHVFSGEARASPYPEDHPPAPRTAYGRTKLAGERAVLIELPGESAVLRTAWLYGVHGRDFVRTMLELAAARDTVDVVDDQRGRPTWTADVAARIADLGATDVHGVFHANGSGEATWYELAREVFRPAGADPDRVRRTDSRAFVRPAFSVLGHERWRAAGLAPLGDWRSALHEALPHIREEMSQ